MTTRNHPIYPDSDFGFSPFVSPQLPTLDLTTLSIYQVQGEKMVRLTDLEKLGFTISPLALRYQKVLDDQADVSVKPELDVS